MAGGFKIAEAYAEIRTDSSKFVSGLARARQTLQRFSGGLVRVAKQAARWGAVVGAAVVAGIGLAARAYAKQERAENDLATALRATGQEVAANMTKFNALASVIQELTTYGDEEILSIQAYAVHLGVTADQLGATTKTALGLSKALGMDLQTSLRYVALATQGEFTMLQRYIPELRATESATEKLAIVMRKGAGGFEAATADAETLGGAYEQMKNAIGDTAEKIGESFAPMLKNTAVWLKEQAVLVGAVVKELAAWGAESQVVQQVVVTAFEWIGKAVGVVLDGVYVLQVGFKGLRAGAAILLREMLEMVAAAGTAMQNLYNSIADSWVGNKLGLGKMDLAGALEIQAEGARRVADEFVQDLQDKLASATPREQMEQFFANMRREMARTQAASAETAKELEKALVLKPGSVGGAEEKGLRAEKKAAEHRKKWAEGIVGTLMMEEQARRENIKQTKEQEEAERRRSAGQFVGVKEAWRRIQSATLSIARPEAPAAPKSREDRIGDLIRKQLDEESEQKDVLKQILKVMQDKGVVLAVAGD